MTNNQIIKDGIQEALNLLKDYGKAILLQQGHNASGEGIKSMHTEIQAMGDGFLGSVQGQQYLLAQDTGIKAFRGKDRGHLDRIIRWIRDQNISAWVNKKGGKPLTIRQMAKNIIKTHGQVGMHTTGGKHDASKQNWIGITLTDKQQEVRDIIEKAGFKYFDDMIKSMVDETKRNIQ